jgi:hypothetical protein
MKKFGRLGWVLTKIISFCTSPVGLGINSIFGDNRKSRIPLSPTGLGFYSSNNGTQGIWPTE